MSLHSAAEFAKLETSISDGVAIRKVYFSIESSERAVAIAPEIQIIDEQEEKTELEPLYRILIHNDHITPMDFVIQILKTFFYLSNEKALDIMMTAHITGIAYVQTLPRSEAEKRIDKAHFAASLEGYPLHFSMEPE